ncbi:MAG: aldo/keto reductase [Pseudomonadota bacterium]|nr:aldo/keto reductase [Pseudomonadota bacterium]
MRMMGSSGIEVAPMALGGNVFGWTANEATSFAILDAFVDAGGNMIDTADVYSAWVPGHRGGESEAVLGKWLKQSGKRDKVVIATKVGMMAGLSPDVVAAACEGSLQRLGVDTIDLYYQHKDDASVPLADSLGAFDALLKAGKVRAVGLSNFEPARIKDALDAAHHGGLTVPSAYQGWYNMVEREKFEDALAPVVTGQGLAMFPFYSLANGFLAGKYRSEADLAKSVRGDRNRAYLEGRGPRVLAALETVAADTNAPLAAVALAWTMAQPGITAPIASATSIAQLEEQLVALTLELTPGQIQQLDSASE